MSLCFQISSSFTMYFRFCLLSLYFLIFFQVYKVHEMFNLFHLIKFCSISYISLLIFYRCPRLFILFYFVLILYLLTSAHQTFRSVISCKRGASTTPRSPHEKMVRQYSSYLEILCKHISPELWLEYLLQSQQLIISYVSRSRNAAVKQGTFASYHHHQLQQQRPHCPHSLDSAGTLIHTRFTHAVLCNQPTGDVT